ncbi:MAG: transcriptional regulator [Pseudomonadota bacterium]
MSGQNADYLALLRHAQRVSRRADEAEDLLQTVLLAAVEAGRADLAQDRNRRWLMGALRKRALHEARSAVRRKTREAQAGLDPDAAGDAGPADDDFLAHLPAGLRTTALLAITGHTRAEIAWLLGLSNAALRQRISQIKRRWRESGGGAPEITLAGALAFGRIRRALLQPARTKAARFATHDPDGHLFLVTSQNRTPRQH